MCSSEELHKTILKSYYKQCTLTFYTLLLCVCAKSLQACPTLCDTMDHSLPGSSGRRDRTHGILQALPCPPPGGLSTQGSNPRPLHLLHWQAGSFTTSATWEALFFFKSSLNGLRNPTTDCNQQFEKTLNVA